MKHSYIHQNITTITFVWMVMIIRPFNIDPFWPMWSKRHAKACAVNWAGATHQPPSVDGHLAPERKSKCCLRQPRVHPTGINAHRDWTAVSIRACHLIGWKGVLGGSFQLPFAIATIAKPHHWWSLKHQGDRVSVDRWRYGSNCCLHRTPRVGWM